MWSSYPDQLFEVNSKGRGLLIYKRGRNGILSAITFKNKRKEKPGWLRF